jgi:hypothetical protein
VKFTVFDLSTGQVLRSVECEDPASSLADPTTEGHIEDHWDDTQFYVDLETLLPVEYPARPSRVHEWDFAAREWRDPRTLLQLQDAKWESIKRQREAAKVAPTMETPFGLIDADAKAMENIKAALLGLREADSLGLPAGPIEWTMADNSAVSLSLQDLGTISVLLLQRGDAAHQTGRALRDAIYAATRPEDVEAITWP